MGWGGSIFVRVLLGWVGYIWNIFEVLMMYDSRQADNHNAKIMAYGGSAFSFNTLFPFFILSI